MHGLSHNDFLREEKSMAKPTGLLQARHGQLVGGQPQPITTHDASLPQELRGYQGLPSLCTSCFSMHGAATHQPTPPGCGAQPKLGTGAGDQGCPAGCCACIRLLGFAASPSTAFLVCFQTTPVLFFRATKGGKRSGASFKSPFCRARTENLGFSVTVPGG